MAFGRLRHRPSKGKRPMHGRLGATTKTGKVTFQVWRFQRYGRRVGYGAVACFGNATHQDRRPSCSRIKLARTPQSAVAKALKSLSAVAARRGRGAP